jgi:cytochrome c oxidase subunit 2
MRFTLLAIAGIAWSLTVLRWSISRKRSPWARRAMVVSAIAAIIAIVSMAADLRSIWVRSRAPRPDLTITVNDMGDWWQLEYRRRGISFVTANELHVPAGTVVGVIWSGVFASREPALVIDRKGHDELTAVAIWPPKLRHLAIVADDAAEFDRWFVREAQPAVNRSGAPLFTNSGCSLCHVIRGVVAEPSMPAPDLTHFASRRTIATIDLPNKGADLSGWIVNSKALKHSSQMPENNVEAAVLRQLVSYLESLR